MSKIFSTHACTPLVVEQYFSILWCAGPACGMPNDRCCVGNNDEAGVMLHHELSKDYPSSSRVHARVP